MGAYLSEPVTKKETEADENEFLRVASASMQGWRVNQEDAHNAILEYDKHSSLFAVYDGHGGHEVAVYTSKKLPGFIKENSDYLKGNIHKALVDSFVEFDRTMVDREVVHELNRIKGNESFDAADHDPEEVDNLYQEATMPIEEVMAKYTEDGAAAPEACAPKNKVIDGLVAGSSKSQKPISPFLRAKSASFTAGGEGVKTEEEEGPKKIDFTKETQEQGEKPEETGAVKSEVKVEANGDKKEDDEKPKEEVNHEDKGEVTTNGHYVEKEETDEAKANGTAKLVKGKGKGKGKGKSNAIKKSPVDNDEEKEEAPMEESKKKSPKKSADELYRNILNEDPDGEEEESSDDEDEVFGIGQESDSDDDIDDEDGEEEDDTDILEEEEEDSEDEDDVEIDGEEYIGGEYNEEPGNDSGCTAVVALLQGKKLFVANAGDSRCVVCRDGKAVEMSFDHKPEDEPEQTRIEKAGGKVTADGRVNGGLNLSRAIGDHAYKTKKALPLQEQMISPVPDIRTLDLDVKTDSFILLACDGIWNSLTSQQVVDFINEKLNKLSDKHDPTTDQLTTICEDLFHKCLSPDTSGDGTGCDNMTAVLVKIRPAFENILASGSEEGASSSTIPAASSSSSTVAKESSSETSTSSSVKRPSSEEGSEAKRAKTEEDAGGSS